MLKIKGSEANRVRSPNISNSEQPTSAPIAKINDNVEPNPIGSGNVVESAVNDIIFGIPCANMVAPTVNRNRSDAIDSDCCDVEVFDKLLNVLIIVLS